MSFLNLSPLKNLFLVGIFVATLGLSGPAQTQTATHAATTDEDAARLNKLLDRVRERLQKYHEALFNITATELITQQELRADATPRGKPKSMVYESVTLHRQSATGQEDPTPIITRTLKSVDGKPAKNPVLPRRSKCVDTNPAPAYGDSLSFLRADHPIKFIYSYAGEAAVAGRRTAVVYITPPPPTEPVTIVEKDDCFRLSRRLQTQATIWIDLENFDVLQLQWRLVESFTGKLPAGVTKVGILPLFRPRREVTYAKSDVVVRFKPIEFQDPAQTLLLPISSESVWILKGGGIAGYQTNVEYTRYQRFLTKVQVKDSDGQD